MVGVNGMILRDGTEITSMAEALERIVNEGGADEETGSVECCEFVARVGRWLYVVDIQGFTDAYKQDDEADARRLFAEADAEHAGHGEGEECDG